MKILRTASLGSNFTGSYKKKSVDTENRQIFMFHCFTFAEK